MHTLRHAALVSSPRAAQIQGCSTCLLACPTIKHLPLFNPKRAACCLTRESRHLLLAKPVHKLTGCCPSLPCLQITHLMLSRMRAKKLRGCFVYTSSGAAARTAMAGLFAGLCTYLAWGGVDATKTAAHMAQVGSPGWRR